MRPFRASAGTADCPVPPVGARRSSLTGKVAMKKLNLKVDELAVVTFEPVAVEPERSGTVKGNQDTPVPCCTASCGGTCGANPASDWRLVAATRTQCPQCCV